MSLYLIRVLHQSVKDLVTYFCVFYFIRLAITKYAYTLCAVFFNIIYIINKLQVYKSYHQFLSLDVLTILSHIAQDFRGTPRGLMRIFRSPRNIFWISSELCGHFRSLWNLMLCGVRRYTVPIDSTLHRQIIHYIDRRWPNIRKYEVTKFSIKYSSWT